MLYRSVVVTVLLVFTAALSFGLAPTTAQDDPGVLNIYSSRHYGDLEAPFVKFQEETGIEVRVSAGTPTDLLSRLQADIARGDRSIADLFLAIDAGVLDKAAEEGLLQPLDNETLNANIAPEFRDPDGYWYGLSIRMRTLVYNPQNVTEEELSQLNTYADLGADIWAGRVCMRPASHIYTVSLFSSVVYHQGEEAALPIVQAIANNVTRYINSDTSIISAVAAGECDVAFVNHYYLGRLANGDAEAQETFNKVAIKWMNQEENGVFFNVNAAGVVKNAANYDNAVRFIEYMSALENQCGDLTCFPGSNYELPTNPEAEVNETVASFIERFGEYKLDTTYPLWEYGNYQDASIAVMEEAGFGFSEN